MKQIFNSRCGQQMEKVCELKDKSFTVIQSGYSDTTEIYSINIGKWGVEFNNGW